MNISKIIFICKKKIIRWIEKIPVRRNTQTDEKRDLPFSIPLQISGHLLRNLPIKEEPIRLIAGFSHADARSYYLYAVVSDVISSCLLCMRVAGWIADSEEEIMFEYPPMNPGNETISRDRVSHLLHEGVIDEFEVRFRKLQEYLCNLICFSETKDQKYFQLFFAAEALSDIKYARLDINEFFGKPFENFNYQFNYLSTRCRELINDLDERNCWFLNRSVDFSSESQQNIMSSYRQRYIKAIQIATDGEKIVLGPTYKVGYGGSSKSAHALIKEHFKDYTFDDIKHVINKIPVICLNILSRASEIAGIECPQNFRETLERAKSGEGATERLKNFTQRSLDIGDLVTTDGSDVAEILETHTSSYGYKSYRVRYLINPKIEEIEVEWLPSRYIGPCLLKKQGVRNLFMQDVVPLLGEKSIDLVDKLTDTALYDHAKTVILKMAESGDLKIFFKAKKEN